MRILIAASLACSLAFPAGADDFGILNPEEGGLSRLQENIALHPDRTGMLCWIAYEIQKGGGNDAAAAAEAMQICAASGNAPSMILLAHAYENGLGVEKDMQTATHWVREAALSGYSLGEYHYGMALLNGTGTKTDPVAARHWLSLAAEHGIADAKTALQELGES